MPRDVEPDVRRVDGILLYDLEGLERAVKGHAEERSAAAESAEKIIAAERKRSADKLQAETVVPTIVALRQRLEEICRQELESFIEERGPFTREQDQSLHAITAQVIQKIASSLARELKELPEKEEQERMTAAVTRLFHLQSPQRALAGTRSGRDANERSQRTCNRKQLLISTSASAEPGREPKPTCWQHFACCSEWRWDICFADRRHGRRRKLPRRMQRRSREAACISNRSQMRMHKLRWRRPPRPCSMPSTKIPRTSTRW